MLLVSMLLALGLRAPLLRPHAALPAAARLTAPLRAAVLLCDGDSGGGGGGSGASGGSGGDDENGDGDDGERNNVQALLAKAGLDSDAAVPEAVLGALEAGRIGAKELANWKVVQGSGLLSLIAASRYVLARLLADPRLPSVLAAEVAVGAVSLILAEKAARGDKFIKELDFVLANQDSTRLIPVRPMPISTHAHTRPHFAGAGPHHSDQHGPCAGTQPCCSAGGAPSRGNLWRIHGGSAQLLPAERRLQRCAARRLLVLQGAPCFGTQGVRGVRRQLAIFLPARSRCIIGGPV